MPKYPEDYQTILPGQNINICESLLPFTNALNSLMAWPE